jgi:DNA-binding MarR family transcriptional regulator
MSQGVFTKSSAAASYPMEQSIGGTMNQIMKFLNPWFDVIAQDFGITHGTWFYIRALWESDGISQRELSHRVGTSAPTTLSAIRQLEAVGYVKLQFDEGDRRRSVVKLTPRGRALEQQMIPLVAAMNPRVLKGLKKADVRKLQEMLQLIKKNTIEAYADERKSKSNEDAA